MYSFYERVGGLTLLRAPSEQVKDHETAISYMSRRRLQYGYGADTDPFQIDGVLVDQLMSPINWSRADLVYNIRPRLIFSTSSLKVIDTSVFTRETPCITTYLRFTHSNLDHEINCGRKINDPVLVSAVYLIYQNNCLEYDNLYVSESDSRLSSIPKTFCHYCTP